MKIWLGLLSVLLSFSASAGIGDDSDYEQLDSSNSRVNEQTGPRVSLGGGNTLKRTLNNMNNMYVYKKKDGSVLLTDINPSGNFDKFTKQTKVTYRDIEKDREREWERLLNKKPAARIGMSQKQVLNSTNWGEPKNISTTIDASGTSERWMYSSTHSLYFKNGKLVKIEK